MSSEKGLREVLILEVDELSKVEIDVMVEQIRSLNRGIEKLEKEIQEEGKKMPGYKNLASIKGIGENGASNLLSVISNFIMIRMIKMLYTFMKLIMAKMHLKSIKKMNHIRSM